MGRAVAERVVELLAASPGAATLDLTGGSPELNPCFRWLVQQAAALGRHVVARSNLTVLLQPGQEDTAPFLAAMGVHLVASLPGCQGDDVDRQRGAGTFRQSIDALQQLNALGYGRPGSPLQLDLAYNPQGPALPPAQAALEQACRERLGRRHGVRFNRLLALANVPVNRFGRALRRSGQYEEYLDLLERSFNPGTLPGLMCRSTVSVGWDGRLHDCDFNQAVGLELGAGRTAGIRTVRDLGALGDLAGEPVATAAHCLGCTAGAGSSHGGALQ
jgi:radical SAM/Cys-rich protein